MVLASLSAGQQGQGPTLRRLAGALRSLNVESLLTHGPGVRSRDHSMAALTLSVVALAPHEQVLKSADLLVTHAGHGTVMAGLASGTPMLCLPGVGDQPHNSQRITALGLGETLSPQGNIRRNSHSYRTVSGGWGDARRARAFAATFAELHPSLDAGVARLEALI